LLFCLLPWIARAQPPAQLNVAAIGLSPLVAPMNASFEPTSAFTMEAWIYPTANTPYAWIMGIDGESNLAYALLMNSEGTTPLFLTSTGGVGSNSISPLFQWTHLAAVYGGGIFQLFVNGQLSASGTSNGFPLAAPTVPFSVGLAFRSVGSPDFYAFPGYAQDLSYWSVARTQSQIQADMLQASPTNGAGLIGYWPLNDTASTTAQDISGNGFNLTVAGGGTLESVPAIVVVCFSILTEMVTLILSSHNYSLPQRSLGPRHHCALFTTIMTTRLRTSLPLSWATLR